MATTQSPANMPITALASVAAGAARQLRRQLRAAVKESTEQQLLGGALVLGASLSAGFRWACTQLLLTPRDEPPINEQGRLPLPSDQRVPYWAGLSPLTLLYYSSPFGCVALLPLALALELQPFRQYAGERHGAELMLMSLLASVGAVLAFFLLIAELRVVQLSSGLTLSIAGIFKEVLTVGASAVFLGDHLSAYNVGGLCLCLTVIGLYNRLTLQRTKAQRHGSASLQHVQPMDR